jgi:hypothetical protein
MNAQIHDRNWEFRLFPRRPRRQQMKRDGRIFASEKKDPGERPGQGDEGRF